MSRKFAVLVCLALIASQCSAFCAQTRCVTSRHGVLSRSRIVAAADEKPKMSLSGLFQLMTMGAGAPSLGEFKGMDGTKAMFELEANNFSDEDGNVRRGKYLEDGYVETSDVDEAPSFFANLLSGGKLQRDYDDRQIAQNSAPQKPRRR
jgi:hypothetical protein